MTLEKIKKNIVYDKANVKKKKDSNNIKKPKQKESQNKYWKQYKNGTLTLNQVMDNGIKIVHAGQMLHDHELCEICWAASRLSGSHHPTSSATADLPLSCKVLHYYDIIPQFYSNCE